MELVVDAHGAKENRNRRRRQRVLRADLRRARLDGRIVAPGWERARLRLHEDHRAPALHVGRRDGDRRQESAREILVDALERDRVLHDLFDASRVEDARLARGHVWRSRAKRREDARTSLSERASSSRALPHGTHALHRSRSFVGPRREATRIERADARTAEDVEAHLPLQRGGDALEHVLDDAYLVRAARRPSREHERDSFFHSPSRLSPLRDTRNWSWPPARSVA